MLEENARKLFEQKKESFSGKYVKNWIIWFASKIFY